MEKYKLRITIAFFKTKLQRSFKRGYFVWESKEDAVACMKLLKKANDSGNIEVEFVSFIEEKPL